MIRRTPRPRDGALIGTKVQRPTRGVGLSDAMASTRHVGDASFSPKDARRLVPSIFRSVRFVHSSDLSVRPMAVRGMPGPERAGRRFDETTPGPERVFDGDGGGGVSGRNIWARGAAVSFPGRSACSAAMGDGDSRAGHSGRVERRCHSRAGAVRPALRRAAVSGRILRSTIPRVGDSRAGGYSLTSPWGWDFAESGVCDSGSGTSVRGENFSEPSPGVGMPGRAVCVVASAAVPAAASRGWGVRVDEIRPRSAVARKSRGHRPARVWHPRGSWWGDVRPGSVGRGAAGPRVTRSDVYWKVRSPAPPAVEESPSSAFSPGEMATS
jgi:hypothetical protein